MDTLSRLFGPVTVASGNTTIFTGAADHVYTIKNITIVNSTGSPISTSLSINGHSSSNKILPALTLNAGEWADFNGLQVLTGAEQLNAEASGTGLTISAAGLDQG